MKLFCEMSEREIEQLNLTEITGLSVGSRVIHKNAGQHGGSGTTITSAEGTVLSLHNHGTNFMGYIVVTADVLWDDKEKYRVNTILLQKIK